MGNNFTLNGTFGDMLNTKPKTHEEISITGERIMLSPEPDEIDVNTEVFNKIMELIWK